MTSGRPNVPVLLSERGLEGHVLRIYRKGRFISASIDNFEIGNVLRKTVCKSPDDMPYVEDSPVCLQEIEILNFPANPIILTKDEVDAINWELQNPTQTDSAYHGANAPQSELQTPMPGEPGYKKAVIFNEDGHVISNPEASDPRVGH